MTDNIDVNTPEELDSMQERYEEEDDFFEKLRLVVDALEATVESEDDLPMVFGITGVAYDPDQGIWGMNHHVVGDELDAQDSNVVLNTIECYNGEIIDNAFKIGLRDVIEKGGRGPSHGLDDMIAAMMSDRS